MAELASLDLNSSKVILKAGSGVMPLKGQEVTVHYSLKAQPNERVLDSSIARNSPLKFVLGAQMGLPILETAILGMTKGEKACFDLQKKSLEKQLRIPKDVQQLLLEIELLDFVDSKRPLEDLPVGEKTKRAEEAKAKGNDFFKQKLFKEAAACYTEGLKYLDSVMDRKKRASFFPLWSSLQLNLCVCLNTMGLWRDSKSGGDRVIKRQRNHPKARYLRGIAKKNMRLFDEALEDFKVSLEQNPGDERIRYEIKSTKELKDQAEMKAKKSLEKLFKEDSLYCDKEAMILKVPKYNPQNPRVFMDIQFKGLTKKIIIELYEKLAPSTVNNFKRLCTEEKSAETQQLGYKGTKFYKLVKNFALEGGDIENNGRENKFTDSVSWIDHSMPGLLSSVSDNPNAIDSRFFIVLQGAPWLNKKHIVFGRIIKGLDFLKALDDVEADEKSAPKETITIADCGLFTESVEAAECDN